MSVWFLRVGFWLFVLVIGVMSVMEMKAEYSYGFKKSYDVTLFGNQCGRNKKALKRIFSSSYDGHGVSYLQDWEKYIGKNTNLFTWLHLSEIGFHKLIDELSSIGAVPNICEFSIYQTFENNVLMQDFPRRYANHIKRRQHEPDALNAWLLDMAQFKNDWWSRELSKLQEYAFGLWAEWEHIDEAYRLTLLPSFGNSQVIRIFRKEDSIYIVYKEGAGEYDCEAILNKNVQTLVDVHVWANLKQFMDEHFWTSEAWFGRNVNDGMILLFEGWKDGKYHFLDDHSPKRESIAAQAYELFEKIKVAI